MSSGHVWPCAVPLLLTQAGAILPRRNAYEHPGSSMTASTWSSSGAPHSWWPHMHTRARQPRHDQGKYPTEGRSDRHSGRHKMPSPFLLSLLNQCVICFSLRVCMSVSHRHRCRISSQPQQSCWQAIRKACQSDAHDIHTHIDTPCTSTRPSALTKNPAHPPLHTDIWRAEQPAGTGRDTRID